MSARSTREHRAEMVSAQSQGARGTRHPSCRWAGLLGGCTARKDAQPALRTKGSKAEHREALRWGGWCELGHQRDKALKVQRRDRFSGALLSVTRQESQWLQILGKHPSNSLIHFSMLLTINALQTPIILEEQNFCLSRAAWGNS